MKSEEISAQINAIKALSHKHIVRHTFSLVFVNAISMVFNFMSGAVIAATLGPFARGLYQSWRIFISIFSDISNFGLSKFISSKFNIESYTFRGIGKHLLFVYMLASALIPLMLKMDFTRNMIFTLFCLVPVGIFTDIYLGLLVRNEKYFVIALWSLIAMAGSSLLTLMLYFIQKLTLDNIIFANMIIVAFALTLGLQNVKFPDGVQSIYVNYRIIIPVYLSNLLKTLFLFLDQMLVLYILNLSDLGIFAMALAVAGLSSIITGPIATLSPSIARKRDSQKIRFLSRVLLFYSTLIILATILCNNFLGLIVFKTIGRDFLPIVELVPILFAGKLFQSFVQLLVSWSMYRNESKILVTEKILNALGLIIAATVFLSLKSIESAAWISIIALIPSFIFFFIVFLRENARNNARA